GSRHLNTSADGKNPALGGVPRNRRVASSVHLRVLALVLALDLSHHVGDEILGFLVETSADLEALERHHLGPGALQELLDGDVRILDERLSGEGDLVQRLAQAPFDHLGDDLRRLALALGLLGENVALAPEPSLVSSSTARSAARALSAASPTALAKARKSSPRATKSVSQLISTMAAARASALRSMTITPSAATRAAFLSALASPWRRMSSAAASRSPLVSTSAFLHSIMPAPVRSRSCLTASAVMFMGIAGPRELKDCRRYSPEPGPAGPRPLRRPTLTLGRRVRVSEAGATPAAAAAASAASSASSSSSSAGSSSAVSSLAAAGARGFTGGSLRRAGAFLRTAA